MPLYDFECEPCAYYTEIRQGPDDPDVHICPHCAQSTLVKVFINPPTISVIGEPTTIGQLADRNTKKMGKYGLEKAEIENNIPEQRARREKRQLNKKINSMTPEQKVRWIQNGD